MQLTHFIHKNQRERAEQVALVCGAEQMNHAQLAQRLARFAGALQSLAFEPEARVGMLALNSARYVEYFFGTWWAGGVVNPCNIRWSAAEVAYSLDDCDTRILIVDERFADMVPALRQLSKSLQTVIYCGSGPAPEGTLPYESWLDGAQPVPDARRNGQALAAIMYTGGTTGRPKGVMLSHGNLYISALSNIATAPRPESRVGLLATPMFHVAACGMCLIFAMRGVLQVILPMFDEKAVLHSVQQHRVQETFLVPTMIQRVIDHPEFGDHDLTSLSFLLYGAAPIESSLLERTMAALPNARLTQAYGMTELAPTVAMLGAAEHLPGPHRERWLRAAGRPSPIAEICILDGEGQECATGDVGEIAVRGPMVMLGYWNKPAETADALRGGWMHTGDGGRFDADGYLYVVDRLKDMIVTGGENVYSAEVENALASHPAIAQSAVIGVPDDQWGERVHAVVVLRPQASLSEEQVLAHCKSLIAGYKCPRSVEFRAELPLSAAGKLQKFVLRDPYWAGRARRVN